MINYNYLSCTDYDGKTKEVNFCSNTLPETASEDFKILAVHTDAENPNLLHVQEKGNLTQFYENIICMRIAFMETRCILDGYFKIITKESLQTVLPTTDPKTLVGPPGNASLENFLQEYDIKWEPYNGVVKILNSGESINTHSTAFRYDSDKRLLTIEYVKNGEIKSFDISLSVPKQFEIALFLASYRIITL